MTKPSDGKDSVQEPCRNEWHQTWVDCVDEWRGDCTHTPEDESSDREATDDA